jgi:hypothetical protein
MRLLALLTFVALAFLLPEPSVAQEAPASDSQQLLDAAQLDQLVAPIALYPDALVAQVLMASTYPLEIVQADRWAKANKALKGDKLEEALTKQDWDDSVKALVATPTVLVMMNNDLDWTQKLGDAVLAQQADLMDAIQRLRTKAQANGKLATTKQQKVSVTQEAEKQVIVIEPTSTETVYVPYYNPSVVYGAWPYPAYPPYYFPPAPGYIVGGALAAGIAWGAGYAIGNALWDDRFDWRHGNINVNRNVNWQHNSYHRRGVSYNNVNVRNNYSKTNINTGDRKLDFRGRGGDQVLKPGSGDRPGGPGNRPGQGGLGDNRPGQGQGGLGDNRPGQGGLGGNRPGQGQGGLGDNRPGQGQGGLGDKRPDLGNGPGGDRRPGQGQANLGDKRPDLGNRPGGGGGDRRPGGNAFDAGDGAKARDFSKRGQASLGDRGAGQFARPSGGGGGGHKVGGGGGGPRMGGGGGHRGGGGGGGRGGGGRRR